ncbi:MAG: hypothetical protein M1822_001466 [Bathelium mastoideum]|nr:MAG: hypothetical protein M1822_001466 [Bathelium mastoideum]
MKAPIRPESRRRTTATKSQREHIHRPIKSTESAFASSKKDKRLIKHSTFVSKIQKQTVKLKKKRRRPSKKLVTTLESLADALPETDEPVSTEEARALHKQANDRRKALKSRPGSQKRKEKVEKAERERFGQNLAQMIGSQVGNPATQTSPLQNAPTKPHDRWSILRKFIEHNMENQT